MSTTEQKVSKVSRKLICDIIQMPETLLANLKCRNFLQMPKKWHLCDSSHVEKTTFILRYLVSHKSRFEIVERFLKCLEIVVTKQDLKLLK